MMKRLTLLLMTLTLTMTLFACSSPMKAATEVTEGVLESTTSTTVTLSDPSQVPSFTFYDPDDNTQVILSLEPIYSEWHYLDADGNEETILVTTVTGTTGSTSGTASGDASTDASGDAVSSSGTGETVELTTEEAIVVAGAVSLPTLDVDDDSEIYYNVDPGATPDRLVQTSWKAEYAGSESADAMEIYTKLAGFSSLPMKADRVYQITVTWSEENFESVGYYGTLTYMLVTD